MDQLIGEELLSRYLEEKDKVRLRGVCYRWNVLSTMLQCESVCGKKSVLSIRSRAHRHRWRTYFKYNGDRILTEMLSVSSPVDMDATAHLIQQLCISTNEGSMPSFAHPGARSGYLKKKFNRSINVPNLLFTSELDKMRSALFSKRVCKFASIGGGPGYDVIGLILFRNYCRFQTQLISTVFDFEIGWKESITALQQIFPCSSVSFETCDITQPLDQSPKLQQEIHHFNLLIFAFVCVENAKKLEKTQFIFFQNIFDAVAIGTWFVFADSTHRLWPAVYQCIQASQHHYHVQIVKIPTCHYCLIAQRRSNASKKAPHPSTVATLARFQSHFESSIL